MITGIEYQILVSMKGYEDNLQQYIVAINANPLQEDVTFDAASPTVTYRVAFTYFVVLPEEIRDGETIPYQFPPEMSNDIGSQLPGTLESQYSDDRFEMY